MNFKRLNLSDEVKDSLKSYKKDSYSDINSPLRENMRLEKIDESIRKDIINIDSAMT